MYVIIYRRNGAVAQLVEQRPEEPCVTGSSPVGATTILASRTKNRALFFESSPVGATIAGNYKFKKFIHPFHRNGFLLYNFLYKEENVGNKTNHKKVYI